MRAWDKNTIIRTPLLIVGIGELLVLSSSVFVASLLLYGDIACCNEIGTLMPNSVVLAAILLASLVSMGLYQFHQRLYFREVIVRVSVGFAIGAVAMAVVFYLYPPMWVGRKIIGAALVYSFLLILGIRYWFLRTADRNAFSYRTLVYGAGKRAAAIQGLRRKADRRGFRIVGSVSAPGDKFKCDSNGPIYETEDILSLAKELKAEEIVVAFDDRRGNLPVKQLLACKARGIQVIDLLEFLERETGKIRVDLANPGWLVFSSGFRVTRLRQIVDRVFDCAISALALMIVWPIALFVAIAILVEDGPRASILYRQRRVGYLGREFDVLKFRSMREDAEEAGQEVWAEEGDGRITRVGRLLRKYRLDELPQLVNVLRGDMSLVGPRPERPKFVKKLTESIPYYIERHFVKPGITGWAQLNYAYGSTEHDAVEKLQYDLYYVKNQSLLLDLAILLQTVEVVLWGKGAR